MTKKKPKIPRIHRPYYECKGETLTYQPLDIGEGVRNALEVLRKEGRVTRGQYPDGTVYYRFNGRMVNSIEIMRLAGMTREVGR